MDSTATTATITTTATNAASANSSRGERAPRANFSHGRGRGANRDRAQGSRNRGRGGGRPGRSDENRRKGTDKPQVINDSVTSPTIRGEVSTPDASQVQDKKPEEELAEEVEAEVCFICASAVVHNAVAPCNHRTCHICALRLRALYKTKACAHCRANSDFVIFTDDATKRYEDFTPSDFSKVEDNLGIKYENGEIFEDTRLLLRYNCPDESCDIACYGWPDLYRHVRSVHHKLMCNLCTRNKKVFTHEHELFTSSELKKHEKYGDDIPGSANQSGFKGHPECGFCRERFYGDDELFTHCRDKHEKCHICERRGTTQQYYLDYNALEDHFKKDHFLCLDKECLEKKFVVFESEMDLKGHQLDTHPNGLTKDARRDARRVDMSAFDYRSPHQENRQRRRGGGGGGGGGGSGRGRDPNAEPLPALLAQPSRRDEPTYQRQPAIHSAQSISNRTFGGQLTQSNDANPSARPSSTTATQHTAVSTTSNTPLPAINSLNLQEGVTPSNQPLTAQDRARQLRHNAVLERASNLVGNSTEKMTSFRSKVSNYRSNAMSASELIDAFFDLFDTSSGELGTLIRELAEIFEVAGKRDELLKAWNNWRAINEDYPSLPGPTGLPAEEAGSGGKRILRLKNSTAQSSRSAANQRGSWGAGRSVPFPPISASSSSSSGNTTSANRIGQGRVGPAVPWASAGSSTSAARPTPTATASASASSSSYSRPSSSRPEVSAGGTSSTGSFNAAESFPALPTASKPGMNVSRPGFTGNPVLRRRNEGSGSNTPLSNNAWSSGSGGPLSGNNLASAIEAAAAVTAAGDGQGQDQGGGKKRGKKKQVLVQWG